VPPTPISPSGPADGATSPLCSQMPEATARAACQPVEGSGLSRAQLLYASTYSKRQTPPAISPLSSPETSTSSPRRSNNENPNGIPTPDPSPPASLLAHSQYSPPTIAPPNPYGHDSLPSSSNVSFVPDAFYRTGLGQGQSDPHRAQSQPYSGLSNTSLRLSTSSLGSTGTGGHPRRANTSNAPSSSSTSSSTKNSSTSAGTGPRPVRTVTSIATPPAGYHPAAGVSTQIGQPEGSVASLLNVNVQPHVTVAAQPLQYHPATATTVEVQSESVWQEGTVPPARPLQYNPQAAAPQQSPLLQQNVGPTPTTGMFIPQQQQILTPTTAFIPPQQQIPTAIPITVPTSTPSVPYVHAPAASSSSSEDVGLKIAKGVGKFVLKTGGRILLKSLTGI
jgi:hypothetical protein